MNCAEFPNLLIRLIAMDQVKKLSIVVYSDDSSVRKAIVTALGKSVAGDLPEHVVHEFATGAALRQYVDRKNVDGNFKADIFILDGEAVPEGGMGVARQLKDEVFNCPPILLITGRPQDAWLAAWSRAEASVSHPVDPFTLASTVADLLRSSTIANV
jgi:DNA-binding NtrC family response regulator